MMKTKNKNSAQSRLDEIKKLIGRFDLLVPGTLRTIYMKCGKSGCACQKDKKARHGPYHLWDRKVGAKLSSKMISKEMMTRIQEWIEQRRTVEDLLSEAIRLSQVLAVGYVEEEKAQTEKSK